MKLSLPYEQIAEFCRKWNVTEFALFGSVLRDDFRPDSDVDVLVEFEDDYHPGSRGWNRMIEELEALFGREVDLVRKDRISNPFRREQSLHHNRVVYAA